MNIRNIHREAIQVFKEANAELALGNKGLYNKLLTKAFDLEKSAAEYLKDRKDIEPTRSVLFRSAANLAYLLKDYKEAKRLALEGLEGNPIPEIEQELKNIIANSIEILKPRLMVPQEIEYSRAVMKNETRSLYENEGKLYLKLLRENAVELKIEEKSEKFGGAVAVDNILDFLKNIQSSYQNYAEVKYKKAVAPLQKSDVEHDSINFKNSTKLLAVDLNFQSFGISVVADDGIMEQYPNFTKEFRQMRKKLFNDFKEDVLLPDYNASDFQDRISKEYTEEERRKIFAPIISSLSKKGYTIALTSDNYTTKLKIFKTVNKKGISVLKPALNKLSADQEASLTKTIVEKIGNKNTTIDREELVKFEMNKEIVNVKFGEKTVNLFSEHTITINYENKLYTIDDNHFQIYVTDNTFENVINAYQQSFINDYFNLLTKKELNADEELKLEEFEKSGIRNW